MSDMEIKDSKPEAEDHQIEASTETEVELSEAEAVTDESEDTAKETDEDETIESEAEELEAVSESEESDEVEEESEAEVDYLAPSLLDDITTVTPEILEAMEKSEEVEKDTSYEEIIRSSVSDIREDEVLRGRVIGTNEREVLVDIGFKSEGIVPKEEFFSENLPQIGDEISVYLVKVEDASGQTILSKEKADFMERWAEVRDKTESGENITGRVTRRIKGGMVVDLGGVPAFLPGSQIDIRPVQNFDDYVGQEFEFRIVKLNEARKNIVLSRKELLEADLQERKNSLIADLHIGQVLEGRVKNITDFGVFVDLGGLDGLLHITDLSWGRVSHPSEVVEMDEVITVKVIDFDPEKQRVSLGLKQLQPHPWDSVELKYPVGTVVEGKVVSMTNYGAFVEIEPGVEGLIHVSEMSWTKHIRHPSEMFTLGQAVEAKILSVDIEERKISLGVKQLQPDPWDQIEEKYKVGAIQEGRVRNLTQFGAFVELEEGIDGLIHITDLSWTKNVRHPKEVLNKGDEVKVRVLDVSRENRRIALGLKQVEEDPWDKIEAHFTSGKQVKGEIIRLLDKGVILQMEMDIEGIIPLRDIPKRDRKRATEHLAPGQVLDVTVQEISTDDKKVVLMSDVLALDTSEEAKAEEKVEAESQVEKKASKPKSTKTAQDEAVADLEESAGEEKETLEITGEAAQEMKDSKSPDEKEVSEVGKSPAAKEKKTEELQEIEDSEQEAATAEVDQSAGSSDEEKPKSEVKKKTAKAKKSTEESDTSAAEVKEEAKTKKKSTATSRKTTSKKASKAIDEKGSESEVELTDAADKKDAKSQSDEDSVKSESKKKEKKGDSTKGKKKTATKKSS
jgi:small subunit ribosomal protein S1